MATKPHEHIGCLMYAADTARYVFATPQEVHETRSGVGAELDALAIREGRNRQWCLRDPRLQELRAVRQHRANLRRAAELYPAWRAGRVPPPLRSEVNQLVNAGYLRIGLGRP